MERQLLTMVLSSDVLPQNPGEARVSALGAPFDVGPEWTVVSHTLTSMLDGTAVLSVLVEKREQ